MERQCFEIHAPVITFSDCEGGGEAFQLVEGEKMFGKNAYLTVSAQLHAELGASALGRVFTFGPVFRAEKHNTSRHLAEFHMLEVELSFINCSSELMDFVDNLIKDTLRKVDFSDFRCVLCEERILKLSEAPLQRISYTDAVRELNNCEEKGLVKFQHELKWGNALQTEHEKYLAENIINGPVFVFDYPAKVKAFYMKNDLKEDCIWEDSTVACFDLLLPHVGEIVGGSVREDKLGNIKLNMSKFGLLEEDYEWYLDLRRFGSAPHGGFGLGFDRLLQYLTVTNNIRDVVLVPRSQGNSCC